MHTIVHICLVEGLAGALCQKTMYGGLTEVPRPELVLDGHRERLSDHHLLNGLGESSACIFPPQRLKLQCRSSRLVETRSWAVEAALLC